MRGFEKYAEGQNLAVVVISVGAPRALAESVRSLLVQSVSLEIIVVNSGGGDASQRLLGVGDKVKVLSFEHRLSVGSAQNRGIEATSAPFVAFLASDCTAGPKWAETRIRHHLAGRAAVGGAIVNSHPDNAFSRASHLIVHASRLPGLSRKLAEPCSASYARTLFAEYGLFRETLSQGEDTDFHQRLPHRYQPVWVPDILTAYATPTSLGAFLKAHFKRGRQVGRLSQHSKPLSPRVREQLSKVRALAEAGLPKAERPRTRSDERLIALAVSVFQFGFSLGARRPDVLALLEHDAQSAAKEKRWEDALNAWTQVLDAKPGEQALQLAQADALGHLLRFELAVATIEDVLRRSPSSVPALERMSSFSAKLQAWDKALDASTKLHELLPDRLKHRADRGTALFCLGRLDEAEKEFASLKADYPDDPSGCLGLLRIAERRKDTPLAATLSSELWFHFKRSSSMRRAVEILARSRRFDEARAILTSAEDHGAERSDIARARIAYARAQYDWTEIVSLIESNESVALDNFSSLRSAVEAFCNVNRAADALKLISRSKAETPSARRKLIDLAAPRLDNENLRTAYFRSLWEGEHLGSIEPQLLSPLLMAAHEAKEQHLALQILQRIEAEAPPTRDGARLTLMAPFHRCRLEVLTSQSPRDLSQRLKPNLEDEFCCVVEALEQAPDISLMREAGQRFQGWRKTMPRFHPDPCFSFEDARAIANEILTAVSAGTPFSMLRLGDGEGHFLSYRREFDNYYRSDRDAVTRAWWGDCRPADHQMAEFVSEFESAICNSDILGVPDLERFSETVGAASPLDPGAGNRSARGTIAVLDYVATLEATSGVPHLTSCHIHQAFAFWGLWDLLLPRFARASLITCHPGLQTTLEKRHHLSVDRAFLIPGEYKRSRSFSNSLEGRHFPDYYYHLRNEISHLKASQVVLVAAGFLGKIYCDLIKKSGSIALDIGSTADAWCGYDTRSIAESYAYRQPSDFRSHL